jgi:hypothetical protein
MNVPLPRFFRLKQVFDAPAVADAAEATRAALAALPAGKFIGRGQRVAVGVGSRGIANYAVIVRTVCEELRRLGAEVFIVPAMGSHGGATAAGQLEVLAHAGITEATMGFALRSSMEVSELGRAGELIVYQDRHAAGADAIVLVNRIKPHTDFHGPIESGLIKMAAIGLGKQAGASQFHQATVRLGHAPALLALGREVLRLSKLAFGVGLLENPRHHTARVVAVPAATMERDEMQLLEEARRLMPRLPFAEVDLLIVDEIGKNLSGTGMDTNVIRRQAHGSFVLPGDSPVRRIYARSLHPDSCGNAVGIGLADFVHERLVGATDWHATFVNALTALMPANARLPLRFPTDREALGAAFQTLGRADARQAKALWIKNTLSCENLLASEAYLSEARGRAELRVESQPQAVELDERGDLVEAFPEVNFTCQGAAACSSCQS